MGQQQISFEAGLDAYRERAVDLFHENVLLRAHVKTLEAQVEQLTTPADDGTPPPYPPPPTDDTAAQAMR